MLRSQDLGFLGSCGWDRRRGPISIKHCAFLGESLQYRLKYIGVHTAVPLFVETTMLAFTCLRYEKPHDPKLAGCTLSFRIQKLQVKNLTCGAEEPNSKSAGRLTSHTHLPSASPDLCCFGKEVVRVHQLTLGSVGLLLNRLQVRNLRLACTVRL